MEKINFQDNVTKANAQTMNQLQTNIENAIMEGNVIYNNTLKTDMALPITLSGFTINPGDIIQVVIIGNFGGMYETVAFNLVNSNGSTFQGNNTFETSSANTYVDMNLYFLNNFAIGNVYEYESGDTIGLNYTINGTIDEIDIVGLTGSGEYLKQGSTIKVFKK